MSGENEGERFCSYSLTTPPAVCSTAHSPSGRGPLSSKTPCGMRSCPTGESVAFFAATGHHLCPPKPCAFSPFSASPLFTPESAMQRVVNKSSGSSGPQKLRALEDRAFCQSRTLEHNSISSYTITTTSGFTARYGT